MSLFQNAGGGWDRAPEDATIIQQSGYYDSATFSLCVYILQVLFRWLPDIIVVTACHWLIWQVP